MYEHLENLSEELIGLEMLEIIVLFLMNIYGCTVVDERFLKVVHKIFIALKCITNNHRDIKTT
jgi:hypothetical protein